MYKEGWKKLSEEWHDKAAQIAEQTELHDEAQKEKKRWYAIFLKNGAMANEVLECEEKTRKVEDQCAELANDSNHETDTICEFNKKDVSARWQYFVCATGLFSLKAVI